MVKKLLDEKLSIFGIAGHGTAGLIKQLVELERLEEPSPDTIKLLEGRLRKPLKPVCKIFITNNPNSEDIIDSLAYGLKYNEEKYGVGGLHLYPKITPYIDTDNVESMYPHQMKFYERLRNIPGTIVFELSGMSAKDFVNRRMMVARSKSKRRCAISKLNNKIITLAKHSHHYSDIKTIHDLDGMSRNGKLILLRMLRQNPLYGKFGG